MKHLNGYKISSNSLCACKSGKKYKQCCSKQSIDNPNVIDFFSSKIYNLENSVIEKILAKYVNQLPSNFLKNALTDFLPESLPEYVDAEISLCNFFFPWFLFNWIPFDDFGIKGLNDEETIAQNYLRIYKNNLSTLEQQFITAMSQSYYSFYSILKIKQDSTMVVCDLILDTVHNVKEQPSTNYLRPGDIVFSRILNLDNQTVFIGIAPFIIPTQYQDALFIFKNCLVKENNNINFNANSLRNIFDTELLSYFFKIMEDAYTEVPACFFQPL
jgi:hypothetical protein